MHTQPCALQTSEITKTTRMLQDPDRRLAYFRELPWDSESSFVLLCMILAIAPGVDFAFPNLLVTSPGTPWGWICRR